MFVLTLNITDHEDAGYFTNKTLNKLHGYLRHQQVKLAVFFTIQYIKIYASEQLELEHLLQNEAVSFDIKRHIFTAKITPVTDVEIRVYKRMHNTVYDVNKKVKQQLDYYQGKITQKNKNVKQPALSKQALETIKPTLATYYKEKQQHQKHRHYFIIKNKDKRFTISVEVRLLKVAAFNQAEFNSYGLIKLNETPCWNPEND